MKFSYPPEFNYDNEPAMWQNPWEFRKTIQIIKDLKTKSLLEIGAGYGHFSRYLRDILEIDVRSIDIEPKYIMPEEFLFHGDSRTHNAAHWAAFHGPYDVVYIDGAHNYDTCSHDYRTYKDFATKAVMLHDIDGNQAGKYPVKLGPYMLWDKIRQEDKNTITFSGGGTEGCGVGIILL